MNTILQKRIEEAARGYLLKEHISPLNAIMHQAASNAEMQYHRDIENSFINGATYALTHQWISVEEALPEIVDGYRSALVIVRSKYNSYDVAKWDEYYKDWVTPYYTVANVTHWMPIPKTGGEG